jgi:hypothetical protein
VILAINNPPLFSSWNFANCLADIRLVLSSFQSWNALKVSCSAYFRALVLGNRPLTIMFLEAFSQDLPFSLSSGSEVGKFLPYSPFRIYLEKKKKEYSLVTLCDFSLNNDKITI